MQYDIIHNMDCLEGMKKLLLSNSIDLTVTSPPYGKLRAYGGYKFDFKPIAQQLYRVTKPRGVVVWVVGDETIDGSESGMSFRQALYFKEIGFNLHDTMFYEKAGFSNPSNNRYHQVIEYMFVLSKGKIKTFNPIRDRIIKWDSWGKNTSRQKDGTLKLKKGQRKSRVGEYGMRFNIWRYATGAGMSTRDGIAYQHPAIMPEKLAEDHILSWSNEGEIVQDPMCGSGTTLKMAIKNHRHYIGFDINAKYVEIAKKRVAAVQLDLISRV